MALMISPIGIRWLTDGMETSLAAGIALLLGIVAIRVRLVTASAAVGLVALGAIAVTTRIELTLLVALSALTITLRAWSEAPVERSRQLAALPVTVGGAAGLIMVWLFFGTILPDAALAKATGTAAPTDALLAITISLAGGMGFGAGLPGLWLVSLTALLHLRTAPRTVVLVPNLALALLWCAIAARGQYVQGIRHVLPTLVFMISANAALFASIKLENVIDLIGIRAAWHKRLAWALIAFGGVAFAAELAKFHAIVEKRIVAFLDMRSLDLAVLEGTNGIGWDVGHLMYFTKAQVCDVSGLINGRQAATMPESLRLENCLKRNVEFVFVTPDNAAELIEKSGARFADWPVCGQYLFQNVSATLPHYLAVSPSRARQVCPEPRNGEPLKRAALHLS